ncbi:MAG: aminotransferase class V-fold PLP-dependent enzyme [Micropepsaceae bacterium]
MASEQPVLETALGHALNYLDSLDARSVAPVDGLDALRRKLGRPLPERQTPAVRVIDELVADATGGIMASQGGRFFAWVIGGGVPSAMAADWLTSAWDQNAGVFAASPAAAVVEEIAGGWLKALFGLPAAAGFAFVTGAQMAHVTCLAAARNALLARRGWDVGVAGLWKAPHLRVLAGPDRHGTVDRALRLLGHGTASIELLPVDEAGRVTADGLKAALSRSGDPAIVVLQAGELNGGGFDSFATLVPVAHEAGAWVHVDGAFGLWARVAPAFAKLAEGIELCDSWATDGHKYLNVPYDSGFAFVRDANALFAAMTFSTSYLPNGGAARSPVDWNPEFSRRARAFPVYAAIRELGRVGIAELVIRTCMHARQLVDGIGAIRGVEIFVRPTLNQGLVRFHSSRADATDADHDLYTDDVIARINGTGEAFFGGVTWYGKRAMRVSVCNWRTTAQDIERTVAAVREVLRADC